MSITVSNNLICHQSKGEIPQCEKKKSPVFDVQCAIIGIRNRTYIHGTLCKICFRLQKQFGVYGHTCRPPKEGLCLWASLKKFLVQRCPNLDMIVILLTNDLPTLQYETILLIVQLLDHDKKIVVVVTALQVVLNVRHKDHASRCLLQYNTRAVEDHQ